MQQVPLGCCRNGRKRIRLKGMLRRVYGIPKRLEGKVLRRHKTTILDDVGGYLVSLGDREFIPTGLRTSLVVGSLLFCINHGGALWRSEMTTERWISVLLTYAMPYLVSVYGQYSYRRKINIRPR